MRNGWLISLAGILILSALIVWLTYKPAGKAMAKFFKNRIDAVCINSVCLNKNSGNWRITADNKQLPADKDKVESLINSLSGIILNEMVSDNKDKFSELGFETSDPVSIEAGGNKLEIGKIKPNYDGTYIREADGSRVFETTAVIDKKSIKSSNYWVNNKLTNLPKYQTKKITITSGNRKIEIQPKEGKWENDKLVDKILYLSGIYTDQAVADWTSGYLIDVETETNKISLWLTSVKIGSNKYEFLATVDKKDIYKIDKEDFSLLTGSIK